MLPLLGPVSEAFAGLDRPLELIFSPGEDQPPPGTGEGLLLNDIAELGVPGANKIVISGEEGHAEERFQRRWRPNIEARPTYQGLDSGKAGQDGVAAPDSGEGGVGPRLWSRNQKQRIVFGDVIAPDYC